MPISHLTWRPGSTAAWATLLVFFLMTGTARADDRPALSPADLHVRITELIEQLGADEFSTREQARVELGRLGLAAFDALHEAQTHDDIEIALRARRLVRSMNVSWSLESDPAEVKRILRGYGGQNDAERRSRLDRLTTLSDENDPTGIAGLMALCRLVRFEASDELSKYAALLIMNHDADDEEAARVELATALDSAVSPSKRSGAQWIRAYALTLKAAEAALLEWDKLTKKEWDTFTQFPQQSSSQIVRDLLRWRAALLRKLGHESESVSVIRQTVELLDRNPQQLIDAIDWLIEHEIWVVVDDVAKRFPEAFEKDSQLQYGLAESQALRGNRPLADQTAQRALLVDPKRAETHIVAGFKLHNRGLIDWAENEYRLVLKLESLGTRTDLIARSLLSGMLHDHFQELSAAKVLQEIVDAMDKDPKVRALVSNNYLRSPDELRARMHHYFAQHYTSIGEHQKTLKHLELGIEKDPFNPDTLIAMFRASGDDAWREKTLQGIKVAVGRFHDDINKNHGNAQRATNAEARSEYEERLAKANNELAWLVSNTVGDYDEAIRCSHRSIELRPDTGGYYDTLGRCYYAKGDLVNAVKYQTRAADLEPHSGQIKRQLEQFHKALADSKAPH